MNVSSLPLQRYGGMEDRKKNSLPSTVASSSCDSDRLPKLKPKSSFQHVDARSTTSAKSFLGTVYSGVASRLRSRKPKMPLAKMARNQQFDELIKVLKNDKYNFKAWFRACTTSVHQAPLHVVLQHRPPVRVIDLLIRRLHEVDSSDKLVDGTDDHGKTPLHVAVHKNCSLKVIDRLIREGSACNVNVAAIADFTARYPLHWACGNPACLIKASVSKLATDRNIEERIQIISALVVAHPGAATAKDVNGWTPSALVNYHKADKRIVQLMEYAQQLEREDIKKAKDECCREDTVTRTSTEASSTGIPSVITRYGDFACDDDLSSIGFDDEGIYWKNPFRDKTRTSQIVSLDDSVHGVDADDIQKCWFI
jgi:Ankyrin repeat